MFNASATAKIAMETIATSRIVAIEQYLAGFELFKLGLLSLTEKSPADMAEFKQSSGFRLRLPLAVAVNTPLCWLIDSVVGLM